MVKIRGKDVIKRRRKIRFVLDSLPDPRSLKSLGDPNKLPLIHLYAAAEQFMLGSIEDCILHSAFAAEYGLLLRLNEVLTGDEKEEIRKKGGLSFSGAISRSTGRLIDATIAEQGRVLNNLRGMAAHPSNWLTLFKQLEESLFLNQEAMKQWISEATSQDVTHILEGLKDLLDPEKTEASLERLINYKEKRVGKMPNLEWSAHQSTLRFQTSIVKEYSKTMINEMMVKKGIVEMISDPRNSPRYIKRNYPYGEDLALRAIKIAFDMLRHLEFAK